MDPRRNQRRQESPPPISEHDFPHHNAEIGHEGGGEIIKWTPGAFQASSTTYQSNLVASEAPCSQIPNSLILYQTIPQEVDETVLLRGSLPVECGDMVGVLEDVQRYGHEFTEQECHEALTATSTSHVDDCVGASSTQLDQIADADLPPTNQAARRGDLDKIIAPQRILPTLWRNDVTDTKTHIDNSTQDKAKELTSHGGSLTATTKHIAGTNPTQVGRKSRARFRLTNQADGQDVNETVAVTRISEAIRRDGSARVAEHPPAFGYDNAGDITSRTLKVSSVSRPSNIADPATGRVNQKAKIQFAPTTQTFRLGVEDVAETGASRITEAALRRDDRRGNEHGEKSKQVKTGEVTPRHGALTASSASHLTSRNVPSAVPHQMNQKGSTPSPTYLAAGLETEDVDVASHHAPFAPRRDNRTRIKEHAEKFGHDKLKMGIEDLDKTITSPRGPLTTPPVSHLETQNVTVAVTTPVSQEANTRFLQTYPAAGTEIEDVDDFGAPHGTPLAQRYGHGTRIKEHAEASGRGIRTGDQQQSDSKSTSSKIVGNVTSRLEVLTVPSASSQNNIATATRTQVDRTAKPSLRPKYQAAGPEMENVNEIVAPYRARPAQRYDHGTGMEERPQGPVRTGDIRQSHAKSTRPQNAGDVTSRREALTVPSASSQNIFTTAARTQVDRTEKLSPLEPKYQAAGPEIENADWGVAPYRTPITPRSHGSQTKMDFANPGRDNADTGDKEHHRALKATGQPNNPATESPMQADRITNPFPSPTYLSTGQVVNDVFASLRGSDNPRRGMGGFQGPKRGMRTASPLQEQPHEAPQQGALGVPLSSHLNNAASSFNLDIPQTTNSLYTSAYNMNELEMENQDDMYGDTRLSETYTHDASEFSGDSGSDGLETSGLAGALHPDARQTMDLDEAVAKSRDSLARESYDDRSIDIDVREVNDFDEPVLTPLLYPNNLAATSKIQSMNGLAEVDEEIMLYRKVLEISPASHSDRISSIMDLAAALERRFGQTGYLKDLDESITLYRRALRPDADGLNVGV